LALSIGSIGAIYRGLRTAVEDLVEDWLLVLKVAFQRAQSCIEARPVDVMGSSPGSRTTWGSRHYPAGLGSMQHSQAAPVIRGSRIGRIADLLSSFADTIGPARNRPRRDCTAARLADPRSRRPMGRKTPTAATTSVAARSFSREADGDGDDGGGVDDAAGPPRRRLRETPA
jgi:hypothetical protein